MFVGSILGYTGELFIIVLLILRFVRASRRYEYPFFDMYGLVVYFKLGKDRWTLKCFDFQCKFLSELLTRLVVAH